MKKLISASDAKSWKHCHRRVWFDFNPPAGLVSEEDAFEQLVQQAGDVHEMQVKNRLQQQAAVVEAKSAQHTRALMAQKTPVIYQPVVIDEANGVIGKPDFLILTASGEYQRLKRNCLSRY